MSAEGNSNPANVSKTAAVSVSKSVPASKKMSTTQTMVTSSSSKHEGITEGHGKRTTQNGSSADSRKDVNLVESMRSVTLDGDHKDQRKGRELNEAPQVAVKRMPLDMYVPEAWMLPEAKKQKKQLLHLIVVTFSPFQWGLLVEEGDRGWIRCQIVSCLLLHGFETSCNGGYGDAASFFDLCVVNSGKLLRTYDCVL